MHAASLANRLCHANAYPGYAILVGSEVYSTIAAFRSLRHVGLELTRFGGHLLFLEKEVHNGENTTSVPAGEVVVLRQYLVRAP